MRKIDCFVFTDNSAGNFLMPPSSMPHLTLSVSVVPDWSDLNISWCTSENKQGLGCCFASLLSCVCSFWSTNETGIGCTHRLTFLTAQIRACWNADSVCLQCDTEHSTPCRHPVVFMDCVKMFVFFESVRNLKVKEDHWLSHQGCVPPHPN